MNFCRGTVLACAAGADFRFAAALRRGFAARTSFAATLLAFARAAGLVLYTGLALRTGFALAMGLRVAVLRFAVLAFAAAFGIRSLPGDDPAGPDVAENGSRAQPPPTSCAPCLPTAPASDASDPPRSRADMVLFRQDAPVATRDLEKARIAIEPRIATDMTAETAGRAQHFAERSSVESTTIWIDAHSPVLGPEDVSLENAMGRVLAAEVAAALDVPPCDRASTDGYALSAAETVGAGAYNPMMFQVAERSHTADPIAAGTGKAVRVAAGDALPDGADAVVPVEIVQETPDGFVAIIDAVTPADNVERRAAHIRRGAAILAAGQRIGPLEIGALASAGLARVCVVRRPRLCLLHVGRDAATASDSASGCLPSGLIHDADGPLLRALVVRDGGTIVDDRRIDRERGAISQAIAAQAADADIVLVVGGSGNGSNDEAAAALAEIGELALHGVALRPGGSAGMGRVGTALVFLLPGAPSSCLWSYELFAGRAIRRLGGRDARLPYPARSVTVARKIVSSIGFAE
ncbi:MAG TPA: molybdopterin-binding protein, partial [Stellaceae bacterium]|nr:molybdopterin-binding protein [Stellaceae bacterium]